MTKHTQGPWRVNATGFQTNPCKIYAKGRVGALANLPRNRTFTLEEQEANARLIAAAPELLIALNDLTNWTSALAVHGTATPAAWELLTELHAKADAALDKALGN